jgi:hypothetical protein
MTSILKLIIRGQAFMHVYNVWEGSIAPLSSYFATPRTMKTSKVSHTVHCHGG